VIEGLRALPWVESARRKEPDVVNCERCKAWTDEPLRSAMGCGWLPAVERPLSVPLREHVDLRTCPGYTAQLPDVIDVARSYALGNLGYRRDHDEVPPALLDGLLVLSESIERVKAHHLQQKD
jgi:hypothetical protein